MRVPLLAQCALSCNDGLQVSLDPAGQALITPLMIAPNAGNSCPGPLTVTLYGPQGQPLPNPLTCDQIGQTVTVRVRHTGSGNFCDGTLQLQDALSPTLSNCGDKFIFCNEDPAPEFVGFPTGTDNCTAPNDLTFNHFDTENPLNCGTFQNGFQVLKRIDRQWTVADEAGNSSTCLQRVWLKHIAFSNITFPANRDNISAPALVCGQDPDDLDLSGQPSVNGVPVGASPECEIAVSYSDQTIQHCAPAGFTVLRNWTAVDFCTGTLTNRIQIIKIEDTEPPSLLVPDDFTVGTDGFYCTGTVTMPQAVFSDNCSAVSVVPSWDFGNGYGPFPGIPAGEHLVTYTATDACDNQTSAVVRVTVEDNSPPQPVCAADLQVSLTSNGQGYVNAATVDVGSFDNCSPVFLSISRDEVNFFPQVQVSCADQGTPLLLTLRVADAVGLENFCQIEVNVRDFLKPVVQCPANITLTCLQDYTNIGLTGQASASDNCALQSLVYQDFANIQPCNIGSVSRWWTATDSAGNTKTCAQQITVNVVNGATVNFPANAAVSTCASPASLLPSATGEPAIGGQSCSPLSVNYTDQIFSIAPPSCFRIFRSWKVIDHCVYNPNGGAAGIWEHTQVIDVVDHTPPELFIPSDLTLAADPLNCTANLSLPDATATDCSNQITLSHDSPFSSAGQTNNASGPYPIGVHWVTFTATDGCGNSTQQTLRISVADQAAPLAVCLPGVSVQMPATGVVTLDPHQFDGGCSDLCSPQNSLELSIAPAVLDCQHIGLQAVVLTVRDTAGNVATCSTQVSVQDPANHCGGGLGLQVDGTIRTETGLPVHNIPVQISADDYSVQTVCDTFGYFEFGDLPPNLVYTLRPYNNAQWLNGLTTYDLVLISKHILGTEPLQSPYKIIAADANRSGSVTTFDIVQYRKMILGILDSLPTNTSWRFVDSAYVFSNPQNPFLDTFPEKIVYNPLTSSQFGQNFVGIKSGDLNGSTNPAEARTPQDTLFLNLPEQVFSAGERLAVPVFLPEWEALDGFQCELHIAPELAALERVELLQPGILGPENMAVRANGSLALSWNRSAEMPPSGHAPMLMLHLRANTASDLRSAIKIASGRMAPEAYLSDNEPFVAISLSFASNDALATESSLEVFPNPSTGAFWVKNPFHEAFSQLRVLDSRGQWVWGQSGNLPETVPVKSGQGLPAGMYFVVLESEGKRLVGKVVVE